MRLRIFRPDPIPTIRYAIRGNSFSFASLDFISAGDGLWKPMKSNHSVRVQSDSIGWGLMWYQRAAKPARGKGPALRH